MGKILIVVDDIEGTNAVSETLESAGYATKTLQSSAEIFRNLLHFVPDIVLINLNTPGIQSMLTLSFIRHLTCKSSDKLRQKGRFVKRRYPHHTPKFRLVKRPINIEHGVRPGCGV